MKQPTAPKTSQGAFEEGLQDHLARFTANGKDVPDVEAVRNGLEIGDLDTIRKRLDISEVSVERLLHVSGRTLQRRRKEESRLTPAESDRLWRLVHIFELAVQAFDGDEHAARAWLTMPRAILDGETPLTRLDTEPGMREVEDMLTVIDETAAA